MGMVLYMGELDYSIYKEKNIEKNMEFLREHIHELDILEGRHFFEDNLIYPENFLREIWGQIWMYSCMQKCHHFSINFLREVHESISWTRIIISNLYTKEEKEKFINEFHIYQDKKSNYWYEEKNI